MEIYRSPMEKIMKQMEKDSPITNPEEPVKTFFRKIRFRLACVGDRIRRIVNWRQNKSRES